MKNTGILILIIGIGLTLFTAFTFFTREKVVDLGSLEITRNKPHHLNWSPLIGIGVMAIGGALIWKTSRK
jgi:hypothetical protein